MDNHVNTEKLLSIRKVLKYTAVFKKRMLYKAAISRIDFDSNTPLELLIEQLQREKLTIRFKTGKKTKSI